MKARKVKCPLCRRLVLCDDENLTVSHEVPECDGFARLNAAAASTSIGILNDAGELVSVTPKRSI